MGKIRIGILGCANIAKKMAIPAMLLSDNIELIAIASRKPEKAERLATQFSVEAVEGYENLLKRDDIDAVYIPLPPALHYEWCEKAFKYGKHVLVEKPSTISLSDTTKLTELAEKKSLVFMENYMFEYHSQIKYIKKLLEEDTIGELRQMRSSFGFPMMNANNFRYNKELGGGVLLDAGGYPVKAAAIFLGENLKVISSDLVYSAGQNTSELCSGDFYSGDPGVDIFGSATLINSENVSAQISFGFDNYYQCNIELWGSKGKITTDRIFTAPPGYSPKITVEKQGEKHEYQIPQDNHFLNIFNEFSSRVMGTDRTSGLKSLNLQSDLVEQIFNLAKR